MLEAIRGILVQKNNLRAILDVNGIMFNLTIPLSTYHKLPNIGNQCSVFVELVIGEKNIKLYGFHTKEEKNLFNELRKISKIGAQTAIAILSNISIEQFYKAISEQNRDLLTTIPGIGKKTALSIIVEMSSKIPSSEESLPQLVKDTIETLNNLGFPKSQATKIVSDIYKTNPSITIENLLRESLKSFRKNVD